MKTLKYDLPNVDEYDIGEKEFQIIPGDFGDTGYDNFIDEQKERNNKLLKASQPSIQTMMNNSNRIRKE